jgi:hypothetical protein
MVGNQSILAEAAVSVESMQPGQRVYVFVEVGLSILSLVFLVVEGWRTKGWRGLTEWDYMDVRCLVLGAGKGA